MSSTERKKIVSVGDEETSIGFKLAGISKTYTVEPEKAGSILHKLSNDPEIAIIIVTEEIAKKNKDLINKIRINPFPVFVEVPGKLGHFEATEDRVRLLIKMALGIDVEY
ncbi:MAG: V-type ATP synthase subunit F [Candidatus Heimdallarchaeaceae archaeon]